jgi:hypothetical protein
MSPPQQQDDFIESIRLGAGNTPITTVWQSVASYWKSNNPVSNIPVLNFQ